MPPTVQARCGCGYLHPVNLSKVLADPSTESNAADVEHLRQCCEAKDGALLGQQEYIRALEAQLHVLQEQCAGRSVAVSPPESLLKLAHAPIREFAEEHKLAMETITELTEQLEMKEHELATANLALAKATSEIHELRVMGRDPSGAVSTPPDSTDLARALQELAEWRRRADENEDAVQLAADRLAEINMLQEELECAQGEVRELEVLRNAENARIEETEALHAEVAKLRRELEEAQLRSREEDEALHRLQRQTEVVASLRSEAREASLREAEAVKRADHVARELNDMRTELQRQQQQASEAARRYTDLNAEYTEQQRVLDDTQQKLSALRKEADEAQRKLTEAGRVSARVEVLEGQLRELEGSRQSAASFEAELREERKKCTELADEVRRTAEERDCFDEQAQRQEGLIEALTEANSALEKEVAALKALEEARGRKEGGVLRELQAANETIASLRQAAAEAGQQHRELSEALDLVTPVQEEFQVRLAELRAASEEAEANLRTSEKEVEAVRKELAEARAKVSSSNAALQRLRAEIDEMRESKSEPGSPASPGHSATRAMQGLRRDYERKAKEGAALTQEIEGLRCTLADLEDRYYETSGQVEKLKDTARRLEAEVAERDGQLDHERKGAAKLTEVMHGVAAELQEWMDGTAPSAEAVVLAAARARQRSAEASGIIAKLREDLEVREREEEEAKRAAQEMRRRSEHEVRLLEEKASDELATVQANYEGMKRILRKALASEGLPRLPEEGPELAKLALEKGVQVRTLESELEAALQELRKVKKEAQERAAKTTRMEGELEEGRHELAKAKKAVAGLQERVAVLEEEGAQHSSEHSKARKAVQEAESKVEHLEGLLDEARVGGERMKQSLHGAEEEVGRLQAVLEEKQLELKRTKAELVESRNDLAETQAELQERTKSWKRAQSAAREAQQQVEELEERLAVAKTEGRKLGRETADAQAEAEGLRRVVRELQNTQQQSAEEETHRLELDLRQRQGELSQARKHTERLQAEVVELEESLDEAKQLSAKSRATIAELEEQVEVLRADQVDKDRALLRAKAAEASALKEVEELRDEVHRAHLATQRAKSSLVECQSQLAGGGSADELQATVARLTADVGKRQSEAIRTNQQMEQLRDELSSVEASLAECRQAHSHSRTQVLELQEKVDTLRSELAERDRSLHRARAAESAARKEIEDLRDEVALRSHQRAGDIEGPTPGDASKTCPGEGEDAAKGGRTDSSQEVASLEKALKDSRQAQAASRGMIREMQDEIAVLREEKERMVLRVKKAEAAEAHQDDALMKASAELREAKRDAQDKAAQVRMLEGELELALRELRDKGTRGAADEGGRAASRDELEAECGRLRKKVNELEEKLSRAVREEEAAKAEALAALKEAAALEEVVEELKTRQRPREEPDVLSETQPARSEEAAGDSEQVLRSPRRVLREKEAEVVVLQGEVVLLQSEVERLQREVVGLQREVNEMKTSYVGGTPRSPHLRDPFAEVPWDDRPPESNLDEDLRRRVSQVNELQAELRDREAEVRELQEEVRRLRKGTKESTPAKPSDGQDDGAMVILHGELQRLRGEVAVLHSDLRKTRTGSTSPRYSSRSHSPHSAASEFPPEEGKGGSGKEEPGGETGLHTEAIRGRVPERGEGQAAPVEAAELQGVGGADLISRLEAELQYVRAQLRECQEDLARVEGHAREADQLRTAVRALELELERRGPRSVSPHVSGKLAAAEAALQELTAQREADERRLSGEVMALRYERSTEEARAKGALAEVARKDKVIAMLERQMGQLQERVEERERLLNQKLQQAVDERAGQKDVAALQAMLARSEEERQASLRRAKWAQQELQHSKDAEYRLRQEVGEVKEERDTAYTNLRKLADHLRNRRRDQSFPSPMTSPPSPIRQQEDILFTQTPGALDMLRARLEDAENIMKTALTDKEAIVQRGGDPAEVFQNAARDATNIAKEIHRRSDLEVALAKGQSPGTAVRIQMLEQRLYDRDALNTQLRDEIVRLKADLAEAERKAGEAAVQVIVAAAEPVDDRIAELRDLLLMKDTDLQSLRKEIARMETVGAEAERVSEERQRELDDANAEREGLTTQVNLLRRQLTKRENEIATLRSRVRKYTGHVAVESREVSDSDPPHSSPSPRASQRPTAEAELERKGEVIAHLHAALVDSAAEAEMAVKGEALRELRAARGRIEELEVQVDELQKEVDDARTEAHKAVRTMAAQPPLPPRSAEVDALRSRLAEKEAELEEQRELYRQLQDDFDALSRDVEDLQQMIEALQREVEDAREMRIKCDRLAGQVAVKDKIIADKDGVIEDLRRARKASKDPADPADPAGDAELHQEIAELRRQLAEAQRALGERAKDRQQSPQREEHQPWSQGETAEDLRRQLEEMQAMQEAAAARYERAELDMRHYRRMQSEMDVLLEENAALREALEKRGDPPNIEAVLQERLKLRFDKKDDEEARQSGGWLERMMYDSNPTEPKRPGRRRSASGSGSSGTSSRRKGSKLKRRAPGQGGTSYEAAYKQLEAELRNLVEHCDEHHPLAAKVGKVSLIQRLRFHIDSLLAAVREKFGSAHKSELLRLQEMLSIEAFKRNQAENKVRELSLDGAKARKSLLVLNRMTEENKELRRHLEELRLDNRDLRYQIQEDRHVKQQTDKKLTEKDNHTTIARRQLQELRGELKRERAERGELQRMIERIDQQGRRSYASRPSSSRHTSPMPSQNRRSPQPSPCPTPRGPSPDFGW